jgi:hypothetical protein
VPPTSGWWLEHATCRGLALVVNPTSMAWRFDYKPRGVDPMSGRRFPSRSITIGSPESHSPDAARAAAGALKGQTKAGADPAQEKRAAQAAQAAKRAMTVSRLVEDVHGSPANETRSSAAMAGCHCGICRTRSST